MIQYFQTHRSLIFLEISQEEVLSHVGVLLVTRVLDANVFKVRQPWRMDGPGEIPGFDRLPRCGQRIALRWRQEDVRNDAATCTVANHHVLLVVVVGDVDDLDSGRCTGSSSSDNSATLGIEAGTQRARSARLTALQRHP